jgi:hypothetical protein
MARRVRLTANAPAKLDGIRGFLAERQAATYCRLMRSDNPRHGLARGELRVHPVHERLFGIRTVEYCGDRPVEGPVARDHHISLLDHRRDQGQVLGQFRIATPLIPARRVNLERGRGTGVGAGGVPYPGLTWPLPRTRYL